MLIALGVVMIVLTLYVALVSHPPLGMALRETAFPSNINFAAITNCWRYRRGYISFVRVLTACSIRASAAKNTSKKFLRRPTRGITAGIMRYVLFLAIFGVVASGVTIDFSSHNANPASGIPAAAGNVGLRMGIVLWAAALSSVVGAAWTSCSFYFRFPPVITGAARNIATLILSHSLWLCICSGTAPAALLVFAGGFNGLVLPR